MHTHNRGGPFYIYFLSRGFLGVFKYTLRDFNKNKNLFTEKKFEIIFRFLSLIKKTSHVKMQI